MSNKEAEAEEVLACAREAAAVAAEFIRSRFGTATATDKKGASDLVTEVDRAAEELIIGVIRGRYAEHVIVGEEGGRRGGPAAWAWFVDPLDGTNNFVHGYPMVAVSVAAARQGEVVCGVVRDALRGEEFWGLKGGGAFGTAGRLRVSGTSALGDALVATGFPYDKHESSVDNLGNFARVTKRVRGIRRGGSAALDLAYVAAGRLDAFWELKLASWDVAAGTLLVAEAGGKVSRIDGSPFQPGDIDLVTSNGFLHEELRALLRLEG